MYDFFKKSVFEHENLDLKIISTFDVINQRKFENGKIPSNLFCKEVLFHITDE